MADSQYSAGDLNLSLKTLSDSTLKSLDAVISRLDSVDRKIYKIRQTSKGGGLFGKTGLSKRYSANKLSSILAKSDKKSSSGNGALGLAKLTATIYSAKKLGGYVYQIAQYGADFQETLNLWSVSMGKDLLPQATEFVDKMNEAYGVSKKTLMQAQATYKNMLGSLGQISEQQAYILSEGVTQMALDYASLYNQTFDQATTKFQAALAGQVRPIRSVSGYDITETTLFDVYKSLGGEKSMRQLNRTEKQLLSIYAIFQQMERSGATGDLAATMESFANQSRVAKERIQDILSYSGMLITHFLETTGIMRTLNGVLIFMADVLEAVVNEVGAAKNFERDDPFAGITDGANGASDAVDELSGKLLGFDKFRSLNESQDGGAGIDTKLIEGLSKYQSILENAKMEATEIADALKSASGLWDENGIFNLDKWNDFKDTVKDIADILAIAFGAKMVTDIVKFFKTANKEILATQAQSALFTIGIGLAVKAISALVEGDYVEFFYYLAGAIAAIGVAIALATGGFSVLIPILIAAGIAIATFVVDNLELVQKVINTVLNKIIEGLNWLGEQLNIFLSAIGIKWQVGKIEWRSNLGDVGTYANGGLPDKGSMFIAGEAGAEYVYNMPNGQSGVANVQQIAQATYQGTMSALRDWWGGTGAKGDIPQLREANATGMYQAVTGVAKSYGEKWSNY